MSRSTSTPTAAIIPLSQRRQLLRIPKNSRLIQHHAFLKQLYQIAKEVTIRQRPIEELTAFIQRASPSEIRAVSEVFQNLLKKTYPKTGKSFIRRLTPFKNLIRKIASPKLTITKKRQLLLKQKNQRGGFAFLIPLLAPIVGTLLSAGIQAIL